MIQIADVRLGEPEIQAATDALRSGRLVQGPLVESFEFAFASKVGADHAIAVSSGTAALHTAYLSVLEEGDEVLVPAFSHISTASMVHFAGGKPIFCDIKPDTFTLDVDDAEKRITNKTKAIAPVHIFGNSCDIVGITKFAEKNKLWIIWDAAQAHGTLLDGTFSLDVGMLDHMVCYSFYPTKNMTTGEGGMITTQASIFDNKCRLLRSQGQESKYLHTMFGLNYRMMEIQAAIGLRQLDSLDGNNERRRRNADFLTENLKGVKGIRTPVQEEGARHSYHQYAILVDGGNAARNKLAWRLAEGGVETTVHYPTPLHKQPIFDDGKISLPVAEDVCSRILSLPVHPRLTKDDLNEIVQAVKESV